MKETCEYCGRQHSNKNHCKCAGARVVWAYAVHDYYGCDTGCCGWRAIGTDKKGNVLASEFNFFHFNNNSNPQRS